MVHVFASNTPWLRFIGLFQIRLAKLMVLVAIVAVLLSAWMYNREHSSSQRAWASSQLLALRDGDATRRRAAVENLYTVDQDDLPRTVAALAAALSDPDAPVRAAAARSLVHAIGMWGSITNAALVDEIDFATIALIPACRDRRDEVRIEAVRALGTLYDSIRFSPPAPGLPATKASVGLQGGRAVEALLQAMDDLSPEVRAMALWSFARLGRLCGEIAAPVEAMAEHDPEIKVRIAALNAVARGWPEEPRLYRFLLGRLKVVTDQEERSSIGWALSSLAPPPEQALPALLEAFSPDDWVRRDSIAVALGKLGPAASPALPKLASVARIELADPQVSLASARAIIAIDRSSPEAQALIEPLMILIGESQPGFRQVEAVNLLAGFGPSPMQIGALREALKSGNQEVRQCAIIALRRAGAAAKPAIADLAVLARDDPDPDVKRSAADAMKRIKALGPANSRLAPQRGPSP